MQYIQPHFLYRFTIPQDALDENGHVNNVTYVQWMQDAAVRHYDAMGGHEPTQAINATWVVRSHQVEYLQPAFAGEEIEVLTWVVDMRRVRSTRCYQFRRVEDGALLVRGETEWVFVDATSGRPRSVPVEVAELFRVTSEDPA
jgi:acyl-CoA thioester hydrolase